jgi:hypothetical protein
VQLVKEATAFKGDAGQKAVFLVSRKIARSTLGRDFAEALAELRLPVLSAATHQRVVYAESLTAGSTVLEAAPRSPAADEVRAVLAEVEELMAWPSKRPGSPIPLFARSRPRLISGSPPPGAPPRPEPRRAGA